MAIKEVSELFKQSGLTLGSIESFTGGLFSSEITSVPGASNFFKGAIVTYATEEKVKLLKIPQDSVDKFGVVSYEVAAEMCTHGRAYLNTDICVSFTGNAGPSAMEGKPVGEIYIGVSSSSFTRVYRYLLNGSRSEIQRKAIELACSLLESFLKEKK